MTRGFAEAVRSISQLDPSGLPRLFAEAIAGSRILGGYIQENPRLKNFLAEIARMQTIEISGRYVQKVPFEAYVNHFEKEVFILSRAIQETRWASAATDTTTKTDLSAFPKHVLFALERDILVAYGRCISRLHEREGPRIHKDRFGADYVQRQLLIYSGEVGRMGAPYNGMSELSLDELRRVGGNDNYLQIIKNAQKLDFIGAEVVYSWTAEHWTTVGLMGLSTHNCDPQGAIKAYRELFDIVPKLPHDLVRLQYYALSGLETIIGDASRFNPVVRHEACTVMLFLAPQIEDFQDRARYTRNALGYLSEGLGMEIPPPTRYLGQITRAPKNTFVPG